MSQLAARLADVVRLGDVVLFDGPLAAGKTTLIRDVCAALGTHQPASSPTYLLSNLYECALGDVYHIDAYRLNGADDLAQLGLDEFFSDAITLVEWGSRVAEAFPVHLHLDLALADPGRCISITEHGARWQGVASGLVKS